MAAGQYLRIAELTIALQPRDASLTWEWDAPTQRFLIPPTAPATAADVDIEVAVGTPAGSSGELLFESGAVWRLLREGDGYRIECSSEGLAAGPYKVARFDDTFTRGEVTLLPMIAERRLSPIEYPLDEVLIANLLGRGRGVELHSCGVVDRDGRGHLFAGVSGAGKTTTARLWQGAAKGIVSDDRVIVREREGVPWMYGTPWHGEAELSAPLAAPLAGIYLLEQSTANEMREIPRAAAVARLFRCTFPAFWDPAALEFTLSFLERLAAAVPVRELAFTPDPSVLDLVRSGAA